MRDASVCLLPTEISQTSGNVFEKNPLQAEEHILIFFSARARQHEKVYLNWMGKLNFSGLSI